MPAQSSGILSTIVPLPALCLNTTAVLSRSCATRTDQFVCNIRVHRAGVGECRVLSHRYGRATCPKVVHLGANDRDRARLAVVEWKLRPAYTNTGAPSHQRTDHEQERPRASCDGPNHAPGCLPVRLRWPASSVESIRVSRRAAGSSSAVPMPCCGTSIARIRRC